MSASEKKQSGDGATVMLYAILFLFFLQLLPDFIEAIYAFGLASTGMATEAVSIVLLFTPVLLLFSYNGLSSRLCLVLGAVMLAARVLEPMLDTRGKMYATGIGVGCFLMLFPSLLWYAARREDSKDAQAFAGGIVVAVALSILYRALGSGLDITTWAHVQPAGWALAFLAGVLLYGHVHRVPAAPRQEPPISATSDSGGFTETLLCVLGMMAALVVLYFAFIAPNIVARWTGADYRLVTLLMALSLTGFAFMLTSGRALVKLACPKTLLTWNALFVVSLTLTVFVHQVNLPRNIEAYPIEAPPVTLLHWLPLALMLLTFPVILLDFVVCARRVVALRPSNRKLALAFTLASVYLLLMIFAHILTTVYDYIPVIGPWFRDRFWCVHLVAGLVVALTTSLVTKLSPQSAQPMTPASPRGWPPVVAVATAVAVAASVWTAPNPATPPSDSNSLRILSYNIQQGYDAQGVKNFDGQLALIREMDADVIGLSESDTNRLAGGNCDVVRFFADNLNLHSYYGPSPVTGTFGIALLSKYPIRNPRTIFLFSHGNGRHQKEQTAAILAEIEVGERTFTVAVTHLGNSGPIYQQEQILRRLKGEENVILVGDFNFRPPSDSYALTTESLVDSWAAKWEGDLKGREVDPDRRIDHIFVPPGTSIRDSRYLTQPESDHPAMLTEIEW